MDPLSLQITAPAPEDGSGVDRSKFKTRRQKSDCIFQLETELEDVAMLYRVMKCALPVLPPEYRVVKKNTLNEWTQVRPEEVLHQDDRGTYILASTPFDLPYEAGQYIVCVYPLMGLDREQQIVIRFPNGYDYGEMTSGLFRMLSKDPIYANRTRNSPAKKSRSPLREFTPNSSATPTPTASGKKRKREMVLTSLEWGGDNWSGLQRSGSTSCEEEEEEVYV